MSERVLASPLDGIAADSPAAVMRPDDLLAALVRFLQAVHAEAPESGAGPATPEAFVEHARQRLEARLIAPEGFDPPYRTQAPERLLGIAAGLAEQLADRPQSDLAAVQVHGSLSLGDLRLSDGAVVGWTPPVTALAGDGYVDLSFLARDLSTTIGPMAVPALFDMYGIDRPDPVRIEFWVTLRQLL